MTYDGKKICIVGAGGFGRETLLCIIDDVASTDVKLKDVVCFMVEDEYYNESEIMGVDVIRQSEFDPSLYRVVVAIGDPSLRKKVVERLPAQTTFATVIHPNAIISDWVQIGEGSIITSGVIMTCNITLGKHSQVNLHTTIGHDSSMGDFFTTAPAVNISGKCTFGEQVYLGTNSAVRDGITICSEVTVGMGAVVVKDIDEKGVYVGNPLKKLTK